MGQKMPVVTINLRSVPESAVWYTIVTKFNYEKKFEENLKLGLKNMGLDNFILDVFVPIKEIEVFSNNKEGKQVVKKKEEKVYPMYVFVKAIMTENVWNYIRNTTGVSTILASSGCPLWMEENEILKIKDQCGFFEKEKLIRKEAFSGNIGDRIKIVTGVFQGYEGKITSLTQDKSKVKALLDSRISVEVNIEDCCLIN